MNDRTEMKHTIAPSNIIVPKRKITGMSAILLPFLHDNTVDWEGFSTHVVRTVEAGLIPAVNMDTGYVNLLDSQTREKVLVRTKELMSGMMGTGGTYVHGELDLETGDITGDIGANLALQVFPFNSEIKSPVKAKLGGKIEGPPVEAMVGISISFGSPIGIGNWLSTGINTGFSLLKINRSGISLAWGQPWNPLE